MDEVNGVSKQTKLAIFVGIVVALLPAFLYALRISWSYTTDNQVLQTMVATTVLGYSLYVVNWVYKEIRYRMRAAFWMSITVSSKDDNFEPILKYLTKKCELQTMELKAQTKNSFMDYWEWKKANESKVPEMEYLPKNGGSTNIIRFEGRTIYLHRTDPETVVTGWAREVTFLEDLTLTIYNVDGAADVLKRLIQASLKDAHKIKTDELAIFSYNGWCWSKGVRKAPRPIESVILDENLAADIIADGKQFMASRPWYEETGIPYRRGYLLHGPPGCGKTSFAQVFAGALGLDICLLNLTEKGLHDEELQKRMRRAPNRSIMLLEDVDSIFVERKQTDENGSSTGVSFSGLLNALDGVASQEGRIFLMTTNHIDRLDEALIRPGRCDVKVLIRKASRNQAKKMFMRFYPDHEGAEDFAYLLPEYELSMAQIQGHLMLHKTDPDGALAGVSKFLEEVKIKAGEIRAADLPIFDHLRRLNLHRWAWLFEYYGYHMTSDLSGLKIDTVRDWTLDFKLESIEFRRMKLLFKDELPKHYQLCEYLYCRDTFIRTFYKKTTSLDKSDILSIGAAPFLKKQRSIEEESLEDLTAKFCEIVCPDRKCLISIYQLDMHLRRFPEASLAVQNAHILVEPRDDFETHWPTAFKFACRLGLEKAKFKLEEEEIKNEYEIKEHEDDYKDIFGKGNDTKVKGIINADGNKILKREFEFVTFADAKILFQQFFPDNNSFASQFADLVVDGFDHGHVSVLQTKNYLKAKKDEVEKVIEDIEELLNPTVEKVEKKVEPKVDPTDWMFTFLKENEMGDFYDKFEEANILELNPNYPITLPILAKLGIDKMGDRWKLKDLFEKEMKAAGNVEEEVKAKEDASA